jgi:Uma2 family endonuclease
MAASDTDVKTPVPARKSRRARASTRMTLREFSAREWPEGERWELIHGEPRMSPSPTPSHQNLSGILFTFLYSEFTPKAGWFVVQETSVRFSNHQTEVRPDVAVYRQSDLKDPNTSPLRAVPRLVVECSSPGNAHYDLSDKLNLYHKVGVPEYWVVDPKTGAISLFVHRKSAYEQLTVDPDSFVRSPLLKQKLRIVVKTWSFEIIAGK